MIQRQPDYYHRRAHRISPPKGEGQARRGRHKHQPRRRRDSRPRRCATADRRPRPGSARPRQASVMTSGGQTAARNVTRPDPRSDEHAPRAPNPSRPSPTQDPRHNTDQDVLRSNPNRRTSQLTAPIRRWKHAGSQPTSPLSVISQPMTWRASTRRSVRLGGCRFCSLFGHGTRNSVAAVSQGRRCQWKVSRGGLDSLRMGGIGLP